MATRRATLLPVVCTLLFAYGCAPLHKKEQPKPASSVAFDDGAIVLTGEALRDGSGSLLATMAGKVPSLRVRHISNQCPQITLRNAVDVARGISNPQVYVDGTRTTDTCVLESLRANDVERVEVYPQGFTKRPGYERHAHGLILVFMRSS